MPCHMSLLASSIFIEITRGLRVSWKVITLFGDWLNSQPFLTYYSVKADGRILQFTFDRGSWELSHGRHAASVLVGIRQLTDPLYHLQYIPFKVQILILSSK